MKLQTLMYHDVVENGALDASGFPGAGPARYKLDWQELLEHLDRIAEAAEGAPVTAGDIIGGERSGGWSFTVDDGGRSSLRIGQELARRGWRGHFFVTTGRIGDPAFLAGDEISALAGMGHVIGSHSHSHPKRLSSCTAREIADEWRSSVEVLGALLDRPVSTASVPGGYFSRQVAVAAAAVGIRVLFTSEPIRTVRSEGGCLVVGRFAVRRGLSARSAAAAATTLAPWARQRFSWNARKAAKKVGGESYVKARAAVLGRIAPSAEHGRVD